MNRTQRTIVVPVTLALILLSAVVGVLLSAVSPHNWDTLLTRLQGGQIVTIAPASNAQATLYVLDASRPTMQEMMVNLRVSRPEYSDGPASVPILLTTEKSVVEVPINDDLILRMELLPGISYMDKEPGPVPPRFPIQIAERQTLP
jgi:hypothetical protein